MKIAFVIYNMSLSGGMERVTALKASWLAEHGHKVDIIAVEQSNKESFFELSPKVNIIPMGLSLTKNSKKKLIQRVFNRLFTIPNQYTNRIKQILLAERYDIFVTTVPVAHKKINSIKDGSKKVFETHFSYEDPIKITFPKYPPIVKQLSTWYYKKDSKRLNLYNCVGILTKEDAKDRDLKNGIIIPNPKSFDSETVASYDSKQIISVGRFVYNKGFDYLIEAWKIVSAHYPDWHLSIYGKKDDQYALVKSLVERYNLKDSISLNDPVKNIKDKYLESAIFVMTSRIEGFPMVLTEAMECGLPCVAFACKSGVKEIIKNEINGLSIEEIGNIEQLSTAIEKLINDRSLREKLGKNGKALMKAYSIDAIMEKWEKCYHNLIENKHYTLN